MTEREKLKFAEAKIKRYNLVAGYCENCGCAMTLSQSQAGHLIPQTKHNLKKYGKEIIHNKLNWKLVCGLECNSSVNISNRPEEIKELVAKIKEGLK